MLGGLARRVAFVDQLKATHKSLILIDSGRMFKDPRVEYDAEKVRVNASLSARIYSRMGVNAVNVGDLELLQGISFLKEKALQGLNFISSNLVVTESKKPIFPPFFIHTVGDFRIAIFGLVTSELAPEILKAMGKDVMVVDPIKTAKDMVAQFRDEADVIILLSCLGLDKERELIRRVPGIHFIMGGHEGRFLQPLLKEQETFIGQSYWAGMYTGRLELALKSRHSPFQDAGEKFRINEEIADLDRRINRIKDVLDEGENSVLEFTLSKISAKRRQLRETLDNLEKSPYNGNLFRWEMMPLDDTYKEDREVVDWIRKTGLTTEGI